MWTLSLVAFLLQDTETINRLHRDPYQTALFEYDRAVVLTESDPKQALQIIDRVLDNKKIERKDRRLVFERPVGGPSKPFDFFPYQARGRIRLVLVKSEPENASALIAGAVQDLKASVEAGVKSSEDLYRNAKILQERLKSAKPPEPAKEGAAEKELRASWQKLIDDRRFKAARDLVEAKGGVLPVEARKALQRDTEDRCRKDVARALDEFLKALEYNSRPSMIRQQKPADYARGFALPPEAETLVQVPELDWARKERLTLDSLRGSELPPKPDAGAALFRDLVARTLEAEPLEKAGEDWWFRASGQLTVHFLEEFIHGLAVRAKDSSPAESRKLRDAAEQTIACWAEALSRLPKDFLARNPIPSNPKRLGSMLEEFPVDSAELDKADLDACFLGSSPDLALERLISDLSKMRDQQESRLSKEALRKLLSTLVAATAAHELLSGKSPEEVAKGLQEVGRSLQKAGGPADPGQWGPRIGKIFAALK